MFMCVMPLCKNVKNACIHIYVCVCDIFYNSNIELSTFISNQYFQSNKITGLITPK